MADSTPLLAQITAGQAQKEVTANGLFDAASPATAYGRHAETCVGLTWGYYGTRYGGSAVANGTNTCGASTTTYMVVNLSTGAVSFATSTTNWNDPATYGRAYKIVTGTDSVTSYEDHRLGPLGILSSGGGSVLPIDLAADVTGDLPVTNLDGGDNADATTFWRGDGVWAPIGAGDASAMLVEVFNTTGAHTWTKPTGAKLVEVIAIGAGGGGGGGMRRASGSGAYSSGGGGGGARVHALFAASALSGTEDVTVGAGGTAGVGATSADVQGGAGGGGGATTFGTTVKLRAYGGGGGSGGSDSGSAGGGGAGFGSAGGNTTNNIAGTAGSLGGAIGGAAAAGADNAGAYGGAGGSAGVANSAASVGGSAVAGGCGGSGGGNVTNGPAVAAAADGAAPWPGMTAAAAGTSGAVPTAGGNGPAPVALGQCGGGGAGGGASVTNAVNGAAGGTGGVGSGGGGGGNCYDTGTSAGGAGGAGGRGECVVITYF